MKIIALKTQTIATILMVSVSIGLAGGCVATSVVEESPVSAELAPMVKPSLVLNQRVYEIDKVTDEEVYYEITKINNDGTHLGLNGNGCGWKAMGDFVSPALSWDSCSSDAEWHSGENKSMKKKGDLWPLAVGNKVSYTFNQHNAQGENKGRRTRNCTVEEVVNIEVSGEKMDTFKVVCKRVQEGWWQTNVTYFSPKKGRSVKVVQTNKTDGLARHREFLRVETL